MHITLSSIKLEILLLVGFTGIIICHGQNTATSSGNWSACLTWGFPPAIYRNTTDTKIISNGVTVTADTNWSTAAIVLNGNGSVNYNSGIFTDLVNDQGADVNCDFVRKALESVGCASCSGYDAAGSGQYVRITQTEYNALRSDLGNLTLAGSADSSLYAVDTRSVAVAQTLSIGAGQPKAPANSYLIAFALHVVNSSGLTANIKLKYNTTASPNSGYADYGYGNIGSFPMIEGIYYFLIKFPSQTTFSGGPSYIAHFLDRPGMMLPNQGSAWVDYLNDSNTLNTAYSDEAAIQILTTTLKQW